MRRILLLPFRLLWAMIRFAFKLATAVLVAFLSLLTVVYVLNTEAFAQSEVTQQVNHGLTRLVERFKAEPFGQELSKLSTDVVYTTEGARWETNQATVYIASSDPTFVTAYEQAIANWTSTGVFTFVQVSTAEEADIIATDYAAPDTPAAGVAESTVNPLTHRMVNVTVKLNSYYLLNQAYGYSSERILHTAEHELGHAIGLGHQDTETSVMASAGSYHGIQPTDITAVQALYSQ
ncbi:M57 family metalloprotease [Streptococcus merionis]|uniref:Zn-dependent protease n=1 Tax=Streptococcus merionis TaxID=400065 RepID=A0A239SUJ8_9STRE|nr:M57 family metalloprotease [Streptococcus merionis]SNU88939.1 Zn-dependent protease [Streptococcus merionis]